MISGSPLKSFLDVGLSQTLLLLGVLFGGYLLIRWVMEVFQIGPSSGLLENVLAVAGGGVVVWLLFAVLPKILALLPFAIAKRLPFGFFTDHGIREYCTKVARLLH